MLIHLDIETRSRADLKKVGAARYANDPSTEILCVAISKDDEEPVLWRKPLPGDHPEVNVNEEAEELLYQCANPEALVYAHNSSFECFISDSLWEKTFGLAPPSHDQWRCTMAMARRAALPASLDKCSQALNLTQKKDARGGALIRKFCVPQKNGDFINPEDEPDAFKELCDYCIQDVRVEREIHKKLHAFELKGLHLQVFQLTLDINTRGIPVNLDALHKAQKIIDEETGRLAGQFRAITGIEHTQNAKFLAWLTERGFKHANLQAATMEEVFEDEAFDESTPLGQALMIKKRVSYASLKKVAAMIACAGPHDNRVRGTLNDYGAGTGRWSASLIQPQNFKKPSKHLEKFTEDIYRDIIAGADADYLALAYGPPLECISSCIRHFIHDAVPCWGCEECLVFGMECDVCEGSGLKEKPFLDADYSAIEARIIAWQAQEEWRMEVFNTHGKIYEASAHQMFGTPMEEFDSYKKLKGASHPHRQKGKVAELALGYQGGVNAMLRMGAEKEGLTKKECAAIVKAWREASPGIVKLWHDVENASKQAVKNPGVRYPFGVRAEMFFARTAGIEYLFMRLPSGRRIAYPWPKIEKQLRWTTLHPTTGEEVMHTVLNPTVEDMQKAKKQVAKSRELLPSFPESEAKLSEPRMGDGLTYWGQIPMKQIWGRISLFGGVLSNNLIQGIAADVMATGVINSMAAGYEIVSLIHDEALSHSKPGQTIEEFIELLTDMPEWADGLPLKAAGGVIPFYRKD